jgi:hypothetical protein
MVRDWRKTIALPGHHGGSRIVMPASAPREAKQFASLVASAHLSY